MAWITGNEEWFKKLEAEGRVVANGGHVQGVALPPPAAKVSEAEFQAEVIAYAKERLWLHYHTFDSRKSVAGWPDLFFVRDRFFWAELKAEDGQLTAAQEMWMERLREAGAEVYLWRPSDWPQIREVLR